MKDDADRLPLRTRVLLAILGSLALMVLVNVLTSGGGFRHVFADQEERVDVVVRLHEPLHAVGQSAEEEVMIDERFSVGDAPALTVRVGDADVQLENAPAGEIHVQVILKGTDMERARDYFERQQFELVQDGETVTVRSAERHVDVNLGWQRNGGAQITVLIQAPTDLDADIRTSDGDIRAGDLRGEIALTTSDGDIAAGALAGESVSIRTSDGDIVAAGLEAPSIMVSTSDGDIALERAIGSSISIRTSDGNVTVQTVDGESTLTTSDGDIRVGDISGQETNIRTSDGDIVVDALSTGAAQVTTSDGNIALGEAHGTIEARTSSGNLTVDLVEPGDLRLRSGDGDIAISVPRDVRASLSMRAEQIRISSDFPFDGTLRKHEAEGRINGGGFRFDVHASSGEIVLREN